MHCNFWKVVRELGPGKFSIVQERLTREEAAKVLKNLRKHLTSNFYAVNPLGDREDADIDV
jgi:hypothetical protein